MILIIAFLFLFSCSSDRPPASTEAEALYKEAQQLKKEEHYLLALNRVNLIRTKYPYSYYSKDAELLRAEIYFDQENYVESAALLKIFLQNYPSHPDREKVLYLLAESYFRQLPSSEDRDLSQGPNALEYYSQLLTQYPSSSYKNEALEKKKFLEGLGDAHQLYVASFYEKTDRNDAALWRLLSFLQSGHTPNLQEIGQKMNHLFSKVSNQKTCHRFKTEFFLIHEEKKLPAFLMEEIKKISCDTIKNKGE